ncbi:hypothetical protein B0T19DRAFT_437373 [Cercophora scortea]|uniref:MARVEL domain-containing protein n=1 Tax=Cercophora scortea TaxID=314031 RepID=A0AAE0ML93_9PEZI|nr:hypothetical protein B0T19DRAFT_437373 [Cercophora scortea]
MSAAAPSKYSAVRLAGREHIPIYPNGFIALRIVQLVFAVIVIGLAAFGIYYLAFDGDCFILAVGIMTLITSIYHIVAWFGAPNIFNYWAVLSLDILLLIMWLSSFALLASQVAWFFAVTNYSYSYDYYSSYSYSSTRGDNIVASCLAAAAGLGGLEFALHIVSLSIHSVMLHRHRAAGLHCTPGTPPGPANGGAAAEKPAVFPNYPQQVPQPAPAYMAAQQPYAVPQQPQYPQYQQPQQQYYAQPQQTLAPLAPQQTGGSFVPQQQPQQQQQPPLPMQPPAQQPYQQQPQQ